MTTLNALFDDYGQSPWIDNIRRDWLNDGTLARLVEQGVRGVTSNPAIFAKAFATSSAYDQFLVGMKGKDVEELFEELAVVDVRDACDVLKSVHESACSDFHAKKRRYCDGYVSLEVSPRLARDTKGTIAAALKLNTAVDRSNVMIKIPATAEGIPAITEVLSRIIQRRPMDDKRQRIINLVRSEVTVALKGHLMDRISDRVCENEIERSLWQRDQRFWF